MSYSETSDGQIVLTMSQEDYERVLMIFGMATGAALMGRGLLNLNAIITTLNRLNEGNPAYIPYQTQKLSRPTDGQGSFSDEKP